MAALLAAGCSLSGGSSGGINFSLGLQGATNDHPATPPSVASSGPDREYAFVYDNQVWVRVQGNNVPRQVTQMTLSAGADIVWGPLVWSPSAKSLAFALIQNLSPTQPTSASGPVYYIDLSQCLSSTTVACATYHTPVTGSVYGHTYTWFNDDLLIAGNGGGINAYDVHDPNGPRVWQLRTTDTESQDNNCPQPSVYGDVRVSETSAGLRLFYTCMTLSGLGNIGAEGSAYLNWLDLQPFAYAFTFTDEVQRDLYIASYQNNDRFYGYQFASLGTVYSDPQGNPVAGTWDVGGGVVAYETIGSVNAKGDTARRSLCVTYDLYGSYCAQQPLSEIGAQPLSLHAQITIGPNKAIAYQGNKLYATKLAQAMATTSAYAPQWVSGDTLLVTTVLSTSTDASGVTREVTSVQTANGSALTALISGASDLALH
jgi:hypothetical protein